MINKNVLSLKLYFELQQNNQTNEQRLSKNTSTTRKYVYWQKKRL